MRDKYAILLQIKKIRIEGYGSIKEASLEVSNLTVLVGKNGSGKSFILEALNKFFSEFNAIGGGTAGGQNDYLWFHRDSKKPIEISISMYFTDEEINKIFQLPIEEMTVIKGKMGEKFNIVEIVRTIDISTGWHTKSILWGDIQFVTNDAPISIDEFNKIHSFDLDLSKYDKYMFYFFEPNFNAQNIGGMRLIVDTEKKIAYHTDARIDIFVKNNTIKSSVETVGQNHQQWCTNSGYRLRQRPPTKEEVPDLSIPIPAVVIQNSMTNLTNFLRNRFKLLPAARDIKTQAGVRQTLLDAPILQTLTTLSVATARPDELRWTAFRNAAEQLLSKRLEPNPGQVLVQDGDLRLPTSHVGGGEQSILGLMWIVSEPDAIFGIEEPEIHLHANLMKFFFDFIRKKAESDQIFLITHSPLMIDKAAISNNWLVYKEINETKVKKLESKEDFKLVLHQLGVLPSDIYLSDAAVFVEGGTEKQAIIPILAGKLGLKLDDKIAVIALGGANQLKNSLRIWLDIAKYAPIEYFILLDGDSKSLAFEIAQEMSIPVQKFHVLKKNNIEEYYPAEKVVEAVKEVFGLEVDKKQIKTADSISRFIQNLLESNGKILKHWKIMLAEQVAEKMSEREIPDEIVEIVKELKALS